LKKSNIKMVKSKKKSQSSNNTNNKQKTKPSSSSSSAAAAAASSAFPPSLLLTKNNKKNNQKQKYNDKSLATLVPSAVFTSRNFFTLEECNAWIKHAETVIGFEQMSSPQTREYAQRECGRIQMNDWSMAESLYERMKPLVENIAKQVVVSNINSSYRPVCCNGNLRMYKYEKNMSFGRHYDGSNSIDRYRGGNTEITVLLYLSSCEGGATRFHLPQKKKTKQSKKQKTSGNNAAHEDDGDGIAFVPEAGAILMHMHGDRCLEHEADPVLKGIKYVLRTDIVYAYTD
jgi:hypothetical protein